MEISADDEDEDEELILEDDDNVYLTQSQSQPHSHSHSQSSPPLCKANGVGSLFPIKKTATEIIKNAPDHHKSNRKNDCCLNPTGRRATPPYVIY